MKKFFLCAVLALTMAVMPAVAQTGLAVYESDSKLSFACPDNAQEISDTEEVIQVETPDKGFSVVAIPFFFKDYTTDELGATLAEMAANAGVDLSQAGRLTIENDDIAGEIFAAKDDNGILYVYCVCGDDIRGYLIQALALPKYHDFIDKMFETISIEE